MQASLVNLYAFNCTLRWHCRMTLRVYLLHLLSGPSVIGWNYSTCFSQLPYAPAANWLIRSFHDIALMHVWCVNITCFKGHRQRISTVGYKTIFRTINIEETFLPYICHLQSLQIKTIFQEKKLSLRNSLSRYMWFISMVVTSLIGAIHGAIGDNCNIVSKYCLFINIFYRNGLLCCIRL